jgi:uncharacterized RDD family membrane protein YckC
MSKEAKIEELSETLKNYVTTNYEIIKLEAAKSTSAIGSSLISGICIGLIVILFIFFLSLGAGFYLSAVLGNTYAGFAIVAAFYLLLGLILIAGRKSLMEKPIRDKIIRKIFSEN